MQCGGGDYALVTIVGILGCIMIAVLYVASWPRQRKDEGYGGTMEVAVDDHQWGGRTWQPLNGTWARLGSSWPSWEGFPQ